MNTECEIIYRDISFKNFPTTLFNAKSIIVDTHTHIDKHPSIYIQVEPEIIFPSEEYLLANYNKYDTIYTFNDRVLKNCPNAKKYYYGTTWIDEKNLHLFTSYRKQFAISCLCGTKYMNGSKGHLLRVLLYHNQMLFKHLPITFFRSHHQKPHLPAIANNPFIYDNKHPLFETFQFSIIIENSQQTNYFTEKIMDCLITKTIPIYWGCPNIGEIFNTRGWIILDKDNFHNSDGSLNPQFFIDLLSKLSAFDENYYNRHLVVIEENAQKAKLYRDFHNNLTNAISN
jgi:hypothetical protein